jgi:hypothetical protein
MGQFLESGLPWERVSCDITKKSLPNRQAFKVHSFEARGALTCGLLSNTFNIVTRAGVNLDHVANFNKRWT